VSGGAMSRLYLLYAIMCFFVIVESMANSMPEIVSVTSDNAESFSIEVQQLNSGDPETLFYKVEFSASNQGCENFTRCLFGH